MCTVTIIPIGKNDFVLTSNRDEAPHRVSLAPEVYTINNTQLLFPKDELSGGTWIGVSDKNRMVCLLNGAFELHKRKVSYRLSRGVVAKDFLISDAITSTMENYNLEDIEPFTIVIADWNSHLKFIELVWDGLKKHVTVLPLQPKIWSSSTLYNKSMKLERLQWFEIFKENQNLKAETLLQFHKTAGADNIDFGVIMNRGFVRTTSITQVKKTAEKIEMIYENLQTQLVTTSQFNLPQSIHE